MTTLAITLGDPGGIGPEIALKAASVRRWPSSLRLVLIGDRALLRSYSKKLRLPMPAALPPRGRRAVFPAVTNWDPELRLPSVSRKRWRPGITGKSQGEASAHWIRCAVEGCLAGEFDGMVTGPICKKSLAMAEVPFPGHTEFLAHLTGASDFAMMLLGGPIRVVLVTRHAPISKVAGMLTRDEIMKAARLAWNATEWIGLKKRSIGVCALNPHAGENGMLGREELDTIIPAIRQLRRMGIAADGPVPADVIFHHAVRKRYAVVLAMYHDQGLAPLKMLAFDRGVNLTLGLPIVRASPDHGTAFDIAGKGIADPGSMIAAIRLAARLARRKNPWARTGLASAG